MHIGAMVKLSFLFVLLTDTTSTFRDCLMQSISNAQRECAPSTLLHRIPTSTCPTSHASCVGVEHEALSHTHEFQVSFPASGAITCSVTQQRGEPSLSSSLCPPLTSPSLAVAHSCLSTLFHNHPGRMFTGQSNQTAWVPTLPLTTDVTWCPLFNLGCVSAFFFVRWKSQ